VEIKCQLDATDDLSKQ